MMKKIALVGAGGAGKTTLFERLRQEHRGSDKIAFVPEAARSYFRENPDAMKRRLTHDVQAKLMDLIMQAERNAEAEGYEAAVCDRAVICAPVYAAAGGDNAASAKLMEKARGWLPTYDKLYLLDPADVPFVNDEIRLEAIDERVRVHEAYLHILDIYGVDYEILRGDVEQRAAVANRALPGTSNPNY